MPPAWPFVFCFALAAQTTPPPADKEIEASVNEILALAVAQPPMLSIDTRLRLAEVLAERYWPLSEPILDEVLTTLATEGNEEIAVYSHWLMNLLIARDPAAAENALPRFPGRSPKHNETDARTLAYQVLIRHWLGSDLEKAVAVTRQALLGGSFHIVVAPQVLNRLVEADPPQALQLFSTMLVAFESLADPRDQDVTVLLDATLVMARHAPALLGRAVWNILGAIETRKSVSAGRRSIRARFVVEGRAFETESTADTCLFELARMLKVTDPGLYEQHADRFSKFASSLERINADNVEKVWLPRNRFPGSEGQPREHDDSSKARVLGQTASHKDLLRAAEAMEDPGLRLSLWTGRLEREDLSADERGKVAEEMLAAARKAPPNLARVLALDSLLQYFVRQQDQEKVRTIAGLMLATLRPVCRCEDERGNKTPGCVILTRSSCLMQYGRLMMRARRGMLEPSGDPSLKALLLLEELKQKLSGRPAAVRPLN